MKRQLAWFAFLMQLILCTHLHAEIKRGRFTADNRYLLVEVLDDDLVHFELSAVGSGPDERTPLYTSPMVFKTDYEGPSSFRRDGTVLETAEIRVVVNPENLCASLLDKASNRHLTTVCPADLDKDWKGLDIERGNIKAVYGLGQQFKALGSADGDWLEHRVREEQPVGQEQAHGNGFMPFGPAGMVGNVQFPVLYAVGDNHLNYALFLDNFYKQRWDFSEDPWRVRMWGDQIRYYIHTGPDLPDLRKDYMELVGKPPVPPRKSLGLWVSEFGYRNWEQIENLRSGLRRDNFPVDGFVLDLQWFGGVTAGSPDSRMGKLDWDPVGFPDPDANIAKFQNDHIGLVAIEESYINENTDTFAEMKTAGNFFAYRRTNGRCNPERKVPVSLSGWFGKAAMVDWSDPDAGAWLHENRRLPNLARKGITGHWTDLGEPEKYDPGACYRGVEVTAAGPKNQHGDVHNLYNFLWNRSIYDGYYRSRNVVDRRPFILSRSGASGSGRFGVAMWSGDIGSNLDLLASHLNAQMHMSFSGIDYYGSDIGGFRREGMPYNAEHSGNLQYQNELYTEWFANGAWFDIPVRPHTDDSFQSARRYETSPNLVGDARSNRENLRQRYELIPYYYSLAYRAHLFGEPVIPPLVFYYQDDPNVRRIGHEKLVGRDLLVGAVARHGEYARNVYLPRGRWANYHTNEWFNSEGETLNDFPTYLDGIFRLPVFARAGAIIPRMHVDDQTKDAFGHRKDGSSRDELIVQIYADGTPSRFTLYEDDGTTMRYDSGKRPVYSTVATTIFQQATDNTVTVVIEGAIFNFAGAPAGRNNVVRMIVDGARAGGVSLNGTALPRRMSDAEFEGAASGWHNPGRNLIVAKSGPMSVADRKTFKITLQAVPPTTSVNFVCDNGWTAPGENVYVVGNVPALGNWNPEKGVKLFPSVHHEYIYNPPPGHAGPGPNTPKWTGLVQGLPSDTRLEWKCLKKTNSGEWQFMRGNNGTVTLPKSGFAGTSVRAF